jgi:predicted O-methyltransferase YrrM
MKERYFKPYEIVFDHYKPKTICEIGTHNGRSAVQFCKRALRHNRDVTYTGYDLFELATKETNVEEHNGKGAGNLERASGYLDEIKELHPSFNYTLHKGFTQDTLKESSYDFVYVDGGHSYDSVMFDYSMVKESKVIFFDDYQIEGVKRAIAELAETVKVYELIVDCNRGKRKQAAIIKDLNPIKDKVILDLFF